MLHAESDEPSQAMWEGRKSGLAEEIDQLKHELTGIESHSMTTPT